MKRFWSRDVAWAAGISISFAMAAYLLMRLLDSPWTGSTGKLLFGNSPELPAGIGRYLTVLGCYFDASTPCRDELRVDDWIRIGCWVGTLSVALAGMILALSSPLWVRWCRQPAGDCHSPELLSGWSSPRWSRLVLGGSIILAAAIRLPTIGGGMLWDEQDNLRRNFHGYLHYKEPGRQPKWIGVTWQKSLWENRRGNNPMLYSLCAWSCNGIWRMATGSPREQFSPVATRLPAAAAGLLSIASLWWMLNAVGWKRVAPWAALLMAAHPLSAEFTKEARGYGFTLCLTPVLLGAAWRMLGRARASDCVLLGCSQFLILWSFPGAFYAVASINLALLCLYFRKWRGGDVMAPHRLARWVMVNVITVSILFAVMAPAIPQMTTWMNNGFQTGVMPPFWYVVSYNLFSTGMHFQFPRDPYFAPHGPWPSAWAWLASDFWQAWPVALWSLLILPALVVTGLATKLRDSVKAMPVLMMATIAGGMACVAHHAIFTGCYIYAWYAVYILPVILSLAAAGLVRMIDRVAPQPKQHLLGGLVAGFAAFWLLAMSHPAIRPAGWTTRHAAIHPRPVKTELPSSPGMIGREEFVRGHGLWIIYSDGYHVLFDDYAKHAAAWKEILERESTRAGKLTSDTGQIRTRVNPDYSRYHREPYPLDDQEWRQLIARQGPWADAESH